MNNIKKYREKSGLKQIDLVRKTGLSKAAISLFENGKSTPSMNSAYKIAKALDATIDELFIFEVKEKVT
ncbi:helix-turn-helix transcriptional regulator [Lentibacillus sp. N15]|uniref:helix-turn-helix transcriptional regulator n=1 Tax=Lentibacillus songyuanensis TaxID=3136161 RepID=UPI0031BB67A9